MDDPDRFMRRSLQTTAVLNLGGALLFAFPESLGEMAAMPAPAPRLYTIFLSFLVALFGISYAWLARQPRIDRAIVVLSAGGKIGFFGVAFGCWLAGEVAGRTVVAASADLVFAAIFLWWLLTSIDV